ncbi:MAG: hypothetical protein AAGH64_00605 [Planctomycetota bacterium]
MTTPRDMTRAITARVERCRSGNDPDLIARMPSGWAILGKYQPDPIVGCCMLLPDPVVPSINDLVGVDRTRFLEDFARLGDAVLEATGAERINYLVLCNIVPELHGHVVPRFASEDREKRLMGPFEAYDFGGSRVADGGGVDSDLRERLGGMV